MAIIWVYENISKVYPVYQTGGYSVQAEFHSIHIANKVRSFSRVIIARINGGFITSWDVGSIMRELGA
jgi:hypothetical protein